MTVKKICRITTLFLPLLPPTQVARAVRSGETWTKGHPRLWTAKGRRQGATLLRAGLLPAPPAAAAAAHTAADGHHGGAQVRLLKDGAGEDGGRAGKKSLSAFWEGK